MRRVHDIVLTFEYSVLITWYGWSVVKHDLTLLYVGYLEYNVYSMCIVLKDWVA